MESRTLRWLCAVLVCLGSLGAAEPKPERAAVPVAAAEIDALVAADLAAAGIMPNPRRDDLAFARRLSLDLIGRIPSYDELTRYMAWPRNERRAKLIDELIGSPGYVSHQFNQWADLLRVESRMQGRIPGQPYSDWLKQALSDNMSYQAMVQHLLTASGGLWENGATGYYLRDQGMNQDNMANTVQLFLGTRIQCAQCHDHPYDVWTQGQFMGMAAFTSQLRTGGPQASLPQLKPKDIQAIRKELPREAEQAISRFLRNVAPGVLPPKRATIRLADDFRGSDGEPGDVVRAHSLWGAPATVDAKGDSLQTLADWVTDDSNERFAMVIANRSWKWIMGQGLIEPIDDLRADSVASNPALMAHLSALIKELDYDLQAYHRILVSTDTYQREAGMVNPDQAYRFPGPSLKRLSAEQVWDSLMTLVVPDLDLRTGRRDTDFSDQYAEIRALDRAGFAAMAKKLGDVAKQAESLRRQRRDELTQAERARKNGDEAAAEQAQREAARIGRQLRDIAQHTGAETPMLAMMMNMKMSPAPDAPKKRPDPRWKGLDARWVRASELKQPMPPGHFLRDFGQSDRQTIDASNREATVVQALTLLNGTVDQVILSKNAKLTQHLRATSSRDQRIRLLFLAVLAREPADHEWQAAREISGGNADAAAADLTWALINTTEFLFQH
ncbi:MAG: DUF1549 domain-containing protein [Planctomycetota bacterium]|nr:DUF1549 domain-containing protein [Planctomycetota bacterium]